MNIGDQFIKLFDERFGNLPTEKMGKDFISKTLSNTERGVDPTGKPYTAYEPETERRKGSGTVDMRDRSRSIETMDQQARKDSTRITIPGTSGYGSSSRPGAEVFYYHQKGTAKGGKRRKIFPEPEDATSSGVQEITDEFAKTIAEHFNG